VISIWRLLDPWIPHLHVWWLEAFLKPTEPADDRIEELVGFLKKQADPPRAAAAGEAIAAGESVRLDRLETKLDAQRTALTAVSPLTIATAAWAISNECWPALIATLLAGTYLVAGYVIALRGSSANPRYVFSATLLVEDLSGRDDAGLRASAARLIYAQANEIRAVKVTNYIFCAQRSALLAAALTAAAAGILIAAST